MKEKKATIREVAALAGVSISSVSRYLKDPKSIQPLAAYNIKNAIRELEYEPNLFAQNLKRGKTNIIGLVVPHMEYCFGRVCRGVSDYFFERKDVYKRQLKAVAAVVSLLFAVLMLYPMIFAVSSSMKDNAKIYEVPPKLMPDAANSVSLVLDYTDVEFDSEEQTVSYTHLDYHIRSRCRFPRFLSQNFSKAPLHFQYVLLSDTPQSFSLSFP